MADERGRREVLKALMGTAGAGLLLPAVSDAHPIRKHLADAEGVARADTRASAPAARPEFLDAHQMATLTSLAESIVPGSTAPRVPPFLHQLLAVDTHDNQRQFLAALASVDAAAASRHGHPWIA